MATVSVHSLFHKAGVEAQQGRWCRAERATFQSNVPRLWRTAEIDRNKCLLTKA